MGAWLLLPRASGRAVVWICLFALSFLSMERTVSTVEPHIFNKDVTYEDIQPLFMTRRAMDGGTENYQPEEKKSDIDDSSKIKGTPSLRNDESYRLALSSASDDEKTSVIITWDGLDAMNAFVDSIWTGNLFCQTLRETREAIEQEQNKTSLETESNNWVTLKMSFGCQDLFMRSDFGTGNFIMALYMMRLSAGYKGNVTLDMSCTDAEETKSFLILPWLMSRRTHRSDPVAQAIVKKELEKEVWEVDEFACERFVLTPLGLLIQDMQYDFRKMAIAMVGTIPNHPSTDFAEQYLYEQNDPRTVWKRGDIWNMTSSISPQIANPLRSDPPLFSDVELDDAVIHFRCGDLLKTDLENYGFLRFSAFVRHISPDARTIGILTQPFGNETDDDNNHAQQRRQHDSGPEISRRCRVLVTALQGYIQERHPKAKVNIRNDPEETITIAYARIIMANESVAAMSTFSIFPIMATFGTGYFLRPESSHPNAWFRNYPVSLDLMTKRKNVVVFDVEEGAIRVGGTTRITWDENGDESVLEWFRS